MRKAIKGIFIGNILLAERNGSQGARYLLYFLLDMEIDRVFALDGMESHVEFAAFDRVSDFFRTSAQLVVCDENTRKILPDGIGRVLVLKAGERYKNWRSVEAILHKAVEHELGRDTLFAGFGGGVVCDITAFAASVYMRGCAVALAPTTLLAMVDASIGGKTGIDFGGFKNLVGTFSPAGKVLVCFDVLDTLPDREFKSGLGEVIKHALLGAPDLLDLLEDRHRDVVGRERSAMSLCVARSLDVKGEIVQKDFTENGLRAHLNFGHTFAHALESVSDFSRSHGEAVGWGIGRALRAGVLAGITDPDYERRVLNLLTLYGFDVQVENLPVDRIIEAMRQDKKKRGGRLRFVLQRNLGDTMIAELHDDVLKRSLEEQLSL